MESQLKLFGGKARTRIVVATIALRDTYPREVARLATVPIGTAQRVIGDLETDGIVVTRLSGNQRRVTLNPQWVAADELRTLALRLLDAIPDLRMALEAERRRPRRRRKPRDRSGRNAA